MERDRDYEPDFDSLKTLLLEMAQEHAVATLLEMIVRQLARRPHVALARIWLIQEGDCPCPEEASACDDHTKCLHLVASEGRPITDKYADWSRLDGDFSRFPLGARKVGWIAATGKAMEVNDIEKDSKWIARPEWARREGILGFGGQPLLYKGEVLGVLAVFSRLRLRHEELIWMRMIADHAATAIVNARAFEEIKRLQEQLALECSYLREEVREARAFGDIVGQSDALKNVLKQVELVAATNANVIILGESGTGKELVAREIHKRSLRHARPLIKVNCASIFLGLIEKRGNRKLPRLSTSNLKQLRNYDWPGNVRELQNVIERAAITSQGRAFQFVLPQEDGFGHLHQVTPSDSEPNDEWVVVPESEMRRRERQNIIAALKKSNGKIYGTGGAVRILGIKSTTLSSRISKMRIKKPAV